MLDLDFCSVVADYWRSSERKSTILLNVHKGVGYGTG